MITIIDYGLGNVLAFVNIYRRLNIQVSVATSVCDLTGTNKIILPGVGAFDHAMERLNGSGMRQEIEHLVLKQGVPILGICVGMQMLANSSEEGKLPGLGWIEGTVKKFNIHKSFRNAPVPHMGWDDVKPVVDCSLFKGIGNDPRFYFLHSYYFHCASNSSILAECDYGVNFCCAAINRNIYGVQFHPEKSHHYGIRLLKNFAEL